MFGSLGWLEIVTLMVVALLVFGPDKLPSVARDAAQMLRQVRDLAKNARSQIRTELGPEFSDFDLDSLNPRTFVRKNLFEDDDEQDERTRQRSAGKSSAGESSAGQRRPPTGGAAEQTPYDPDTT